MNSRRAKPTPLLGMLALWKQLSGFPTFNIILIGNFKLLSTLILSTENGKTPLYTLPTSPSAHEIVTGKSWPADTNFSNTVVAQLVPTTALIPNSLATMAAWHVRPPLLVIIPADIFMSGSQSGVVISVTKISPAMNMSCSSILFKIRTLPVLILSPTATPWTKQVLDEVRAVDLSKTYLHISKL